MNELALFAGAGGGILGSHLLGWRTVCAVERDAYASQVLAQRQNDGFLKPFPIWSDITTFDGKPWKGIVDVISGGFPCQDISSAGKGAGINGARSGLWSEMARIIGEVRPCYVFVENSPLLISRGLTRVISDLAEMGYDAQWARLSASNFGAPHIRDRLWIVGYSRSERLNTGRENNNQYDRHFTSSTNKNPRTLANSQSIGCETNGLSIGTQQEKSLFGVRSKKLAYSTSFRLSRPGESWFTSDPAENPEGQTDRTFYECVGHIWGIKSQLGRVANGVAHRVDRLKAIGNGQFPEVARSAFRILGDDHD
ncbi:DNA cytosine methyltransferase [Acinetobacter pittii]|uniref:DNA cytosine methyltransferase n=1 Tax=Acinetobacter pittii TaxID=48296 RepID=UPI001022C548|nr:DNA cytosine methyltransferase [Acinetobacter pittii]RZH03137.1 DNA cytosine methyltransferase [Acinetobacter pittii]